MAATTTFKVGDRVRALVEQYDEEECPRYAGIGSTGTVVRIEHYRSPQGFAVMVQFDAGPCITVDEADVGGIDGQIERLGA